MRFVRSCVVVMLAVVTVFAGLQVVSAAGSTPSFRWKVSSLTGSSRVSISSVFLTNSTGLVSWKVSGKGCSKSGTKIVTGPSGSCRVAITVRATSRFKSIVAAKWISISTIDPSCANGGTCVEGDTGPGGGIVFYVAATPFSCGPTMGSFCTYLEAAPSGWSVSPASGCSTAGTGSRDPLCVWSGNVSVYFSGSGTAIGTGYQNTSLMIAQDATAGKAGTASRAFQGGGLLDWFLPSKDELNEMCTYFSYPFPSTALGICLGDASTGRDGVGGFVADVYWSSSVSQNVYAWYQTFKWGAQFGEGGATKEYALYVRPVRAF